jgi:hypothetical protein
VTADFVAMLLIKFIRPPAARVRLPDRHSAARHLSRTAVSKERDQH